MTESPGAKHKYSQPTIISALATVRTYFYKHGNSCPFKTKIIITRQRSSFAQIINSRGSR